MIKQATLDAMSHYGGLFVQTLAELYGIADEHNAQILEKGFNEIFEQYKKIAEQEN